MRMQIGRPYRIMLVLATSLFVAACSDDDLTGPGDDTDPVGSPPVASFTAVPPTVPSGDNDQTIVTLDGSASDDPDGGPLTYSWIVPNGTFVEGTSASSAVARVTFPGTAPYAVSLTVTDEDGRSNTFTFTVGLS